MLGTRVLIAARRLTAARWARRRPLEELLFDLSELLPGAPRPKEKPRAEQLRAAYLKAALYLHPDKVQAHGLGDEALGVANECFILLKERYEARG